MDPSYNSPLLRRASAARAPSTSSFYDITDHIATLTTTDLLCRFTHTGHGRALEFHRSAQLIIPAVCARVGALHIVLDGGMRKDRAHAPVHSDLSGDHHAANARDNEVSRRIARARRFSQSRVFTERSFRTGQDTRTNPSHRHNRNPHSGPSNPHVSSGASLGSPPIRALRPL